MLSAAIVPDGDGAFGPAVAHRESGVADPAGEIVQQGLAFLVTLLPDEIRVLLSEFLQLFSVTAAGNHLQMAIEIGQGFGSDRATAVDQLGRDLLVDRSEADGLHAPVSHRQAGGRQVGIAAHHQRQKVIEVGRDDKPQFHAKIFREAPDQLELKTGRSIRTFIVGGGAVARQDDEFVLVPDLLQQGRGFAAGGE